MADRHPWFGGHIPTTQSRKPQDDSSDTKFTDNILDLAITDYERRHQTAAARPASLVVDTSKHFLPFRMTDHNDASDLDISTPSKWYLPSGILTPSRATSPESDPFITAGEKGKAAELKLPERAHGQTYKKENIMGTFKPMRQPINPPTLIEHQHTANFGRIRLPFKSFGSKHQEPVSDGISNTDLTYEAESSRQEVQWGRGALLEPSTLYVAPELQPFRPSQMRLDHLNGYGTTLDVAQNNSRYRGKRDKDDFILGLPDHLNTSVFLKNIPLEFDNRDMVDLVNFGGIISLGIVPPDDTHRMCAANLTFRDPESAARLIADARSFHGIWLGGQRIHAIYNHRGHERFVDYKTRILLVEGPTDIMTFQIWDDFFREDCQFWWDRVIHHECQIAGRARMEFRFMMVVGQANMCMLEIKRKLGARGDISAGYGPDPRYNDGSIFYDPFEGAYDEIHNLW